MSVDARMGNEYRGMNQFCNDSGKFPVKYEIINLHIPNTVVPAFSEVFVFYIGTLSTISFSHMLNMSEKKII